MQRVIFVTAILTHYRAPFHERVRDALARQGVKYELIYSAPVGAELAKADTVDLPWAECVPSYSIGPGRKALWQSAFGQIRGSDLVIIGQENRLLLNYLLQIQPRSVRSRIALWGHGRNFQTRNPHAWGERWKRMWATRADWWFAYTDETRDHLTKLGFPPAQITVFNNSVDTSEFRAQFDGVSDERVTALKADLSLTTNNIGAFVGGLYSEKRLEFLVSAVDAIHSRVPDFSLIVVGEGPSASLIATAAKCRSWIKPVGAKFGADKAEIMRLAKVYLMPGLLGLGILDAAAAGLPTITTQYPYHSPEIAYLQNNVNGIIVRDWESVDAYADAVIRLLQDPARLSAMSRAARAVSHTYSIESMADRFTSGVLEALRH